VEDIRCNHVTEIQTDPTLSQWKHCSIAHNPADYLSRGVTAERLKKLRHWWHGPSWLSQDPVHWPSQQARMHHSLPDERTQSLLVGPTEPPGRLIESSRFSSYCRLLRTTAWVLRFVRHARRRRRSSGELDASELKEARAHWIREVQRDCFGPEFQAIQSRNALPRESLVARFNPFLDDGYVHIVGRLYLADLSRNKYTPFSSMGRTISQKC
jgi:hypothetical protein